MSEIEIKYSVKNKENKDVKTAAIEYIRYIQDFVEAKAECEKLKEKYITRGYTDAEIKMWIECEIEVSETKYSYATYAKAGTQHTADYTFISSNTTDGASITHREYTKERNSKGQKIIDLLAAIRKTQEELAEFRRNILNEIVQDGEFCHAGKEYTISEKPEEKEEKE